MRRWRYKAIRVKSASQSKRGELAPLPPAKLLREIRSPLVASVIGVSNVCASHKLDK